MALRVFRVAPALMLTFERIKLWILLFINASLVLVGTTDHEKRESEQTEEADLAAGGLEPFRLPWLLEKKQPQVSPALHLELHNLKKKVSVLKIEKDGGQMG